jgi:PadR family transcriptional regulator, regulatory protein PadR
MFESKKEILILEMLAPVKELFGLEIMKNSDGAIKRGTVYTTLHRMEEKGLVKSRVEELPANSPGTPRRLYAITGLGEQVRQAAQSIRDFREGQLVESYV